MTTPPRRPGSLVRRLWTNPLGLVSGAVLLIIVLIALIGPFLTPFPADQPSLDAVLAAPDATNALGGDSAGRDVLSRLVAATAVSLAGATLAVVVAALLGVSAGLVAGYQGGWFDIFASWIAATLLALPALIVLLAARSVVGPSMWWVMAIFGVVLAPSYFRIVYAEVRAVREELYIDAAKVSGLNDFRIVGRHILTAVRAPVILLTAGMFAVAIAIQASLDFIGVGDPSLPTWGGMLSDGFYNIARSPLLMLWPSIAVAVTCMAFALFGTALRDSLERTDAVRAPRVPWSRPEGDVQAATVHSAPAGTPLLEIDGLAVAYPTAEGWVTVVSDVSVTVGRGEVHALIGESGSGKTQTAWATLGLLPESGRIVAGSVSFEGVDLSHLPDRELNRIRGRRVAYVPQEPLSNLDPSYTIGHQLVEPLRVSMGMSSRAAREKSLSLLERVGITDPQRVFASYPHEISGGMAQRVLIAGAISCDPDLIVADEPTTALDVTVQAEILELLRSLQRERGLAMLLVTHNFGVVADLADRVSVMQSGRIVESGTVAEVFAAPRHPYTQALFAALLDDAPPREAFDASLEVR